MFKLLTVLLLSFSAFAQDSLPNKCYIGNEGKGDGKQWICSLGPKNAPQKGSELYKSCQCENYNEDVVETETPSAGHFCADDRLAGKNVSSEALSAKKKGAKVNKEQP